MTCRASSGESMTQVASSASAGDPLSIGPENTRRGPVHSPEVMRVGELRDISSHVADSPDSVSEKQAQSAIVAISVDVHIPKSGE